MSQKITRHIKEMVEDANTRVKTLSFDEAQAVLSSDTHVFVDIRDIRELQRSGKIPGAFHAPRGMLEFWIDPESPYHRAVFDEDKTYVFYCASAWRSALAADMAQSMGLSPVVHLEGGFTHWERSGGAVDKVD
ncbi:MAG: rhodanese-like domain-containing protein [Pseudomonadota bacterium]